MKKRKSRKRRSAAQVAAFSKMLAGLRRHKAKKNSRKGKRNPAWRRKRVSAAVAEARAGLIPQSDYEPQPRRARRATRRTRRTSLGGAKKKLMRIANPLVARAVARALRLMGHRVDVKRK